MVTFKNGILRIEKSENDRFFRLPYEICFYLGFIFYFLDFSSLHYVGVAAMLAGPAIITAGKLYNRKLNNVTLSVWYLLFIIYAEISSTWAYSPATSALKYVKFMLVSLVVCFGMTQYVDDKKSFEKLLDVYLYASLTIALIEFLGTPFGQWFNGYFGAAVGGGNTNVFGYIILYASIIGFYKAYFLHKRLWYPAVVLFLFGCVLSSSRKAIIVSVLGILLLLLLSFGRKHHILHFMLAIGTAAIVFTFFMTNDYLYSAIGNRIEALIKFANDEEIKYGSLQLREYFIDFAQLLFKRKPLLGHGFANFATLIALETTMRHVYAHNNYWEILADLGIIGFIFYYWLYIYTGIKLIATFLRNKFTFMKLLAFTMLISEFILEWGVISMYNVFSQIIIAIIFINAITDDSEDRKQFYYSGAVTDLSGGE